MIKNTIAIIVIVLLFVLHFMPALMLHLHPDQGAWGLAYIGLGGLDIAWGCVMYEHYFKTGY